MSSKPESEKPSASGARPYQAPTLMKGPVLTSVTAIKAVSGALPLK
jgi:hypothetical protein